MSIGSPTLSRRLAYALYMHTAPTSHFIGSRKPKVARLHLAPATDRTPAGHAGSPTFSWVAEGVCGPGTC